MAKVGKFCLAKRVKVEWLFHMVYETENGEYAGYYLLKPYGTDNGWIMPFGSKEISYSEGVLENPDRPERPNEDPNFRRE